MALHLKAHNFLGYLYPFRRLGHKLPVAQTVAPHIEVSVAVENCQLVFGAPSVVDYDSA
jgi:hypothetical protein